MRNNKRNSTTIYVIAIAVIIVAFLLLGGGHWTNGMMHGSRMSIGNWNWAQIIICLGLGFILGLLYSRRKI